VRALRLKAHGRKERDSILENVTAVEIDFIISHGRRFTSLEKG